MEKYLAPGPGQGLAIYLHFDVVMPWAMRGGWDPC